MKKVFGKLLMLALCAVLLSVAAVAADPVTYTPGTDGTYTVPYTEGTASSFYALLVVDGIYEEGDAPTISEETVLYIDQATADSSGSVSFDGWIPKNEKPATVYLGGSDLDSPVLLGYLGSNTFIVSGTVTSQSTYEATVTLTDADGNSFTGTSVSGAYSVEVPEGTYTFKVNVKNHLSYTDNDFAVAADVTGKDVSVLGGDVNASDTVDFSDLGIILDNYNSTEDTYDVNGEDGANFSDLGIILDNYGSAAVSE